MSQHVHKHTLTLHTFTHLIAQVWRLVFVVKYLPFKTPNICQSVSDFSFFSSL